MPDSRLSTIGALLGGAPEHLVERSAAARAEAQGVAVEEVLSAWAGDGEGLAATTTVEEAPPPVTAPQPSPEAPASVAAGVEPPPVPVFEVPTGLEVEIVEEEIEPIEPASLADRIRLGAKSGAGLGPVLVLLMIVAQMPAILGRMSETTSEGAPAVEVTWTMVVITAALWAVAGSIINLVARGAGRFRSPAYDTLATTLGSVFVGGFVGLILGSGLGGVMYALAESSLSGTRLVSVGLSTVLGVLAAAVFMGAVVGGVGQAMALSARLVGGEADDAMTVKRRLSDAILLPVASGLVILVIVVSLGLLLLRYHGYAPLIAILGALGILAFASLMASKPNLRVTKSEVLVAAAGVGVVLLMIALIAASGSESGEEGPSDDHAVVYEVSIL